MILLLCWLHVVSRLVQSFGPSLVGGLFFACKQSSRFTAGFFSSIVCILIRGDKDESID